MLIINQQGAPVSEFIIKEAVEKATSERRETWSEVERLDQVNTMTTDANEKFAIAGFMEIYLMCLSGKYGKDLSLDIINKLQRWMYDHLGREECDLIERKLLQKLNKNL